MFLTRREWPILVVNVVYLTVFTAIALTGNKTEFLYYVAIVMLAGAVILWRQRTLSRAASSRDGQQHPTAPPTHRGLAQLSRARDATM